MSEKVTIIEPQDILDFIEDLGEYVSAKLYNLDPRKKLGKKRKNNSER